MGDALCAQTDPDLFFPEGSGSSTRQAKKVCAACPVQTACDEHARGLEGNASADRRHGAWGGKSPRERARLGGDPQSSERDRQIRLLTDRGMSLAEIADQLDISDRTVGRVRAAHRQQQEAAA
jgi:WhiB family redox-sensing transcriptional regulator